MSNDNVKHPLDWRATKKTPQPIYNLAIAAAWHKRLVSPGYTPDTIQPYDGPVVDPSGDETQPMPEAVYDAMLANAAQILQSARDAALKLVPSVAAKYVRVLSHPDQSYAVIVRQPIGGDAKGLINRMRNATDNIDTMAYELSSHMLWPAEGSPEKEDLMNGLSLAFQMVLPEAFLHLAGFRGGEVKKLA